MKATNDFERLQKVYGCEPLINSQEIRTAFETEVDCSLTDQQKTGVLHYLAHTEVVARKHYRMTQKDDLLKTAKIIRTLTGYVWKMALYGTPSHFNSIQLRTYGNVNHDMLSLLQ